MSDSYKAPTMAQKMAAGEAPEILFWVGCAGSFDDRYKAVTLAFVKILNKVGVNFAVLGDEETCTGDPARRAGNEYPALGGNYEVVHHSQYLQELINEGKIVMKDGGEFKGKKITFHDSCFLGRANDVYEAPRAVIKALDMELVEMKRCKSKGLCCGAGGAQMFKEPEAGKKDINVERTEEALQTGAKTIAVGCPFCLTMMTDGVKNKEKETEVNVLDLAELIAKDQQL